MNMEAPKIIVALDFSSEKEAVKLAKKLSPALCALKVGKELFTSCGPKIVERLVNQGFNVFLDLKFHDIPSTVEKACLAAVNLGVWMMNVHCFGGLEMMQAAREAVDSTENEPPLLIGVTVLTSLHQADLEQLGITTAVEQEVLNLAELAKQARLDGVVASAQEARQIKQNLGKDFHIITPGIRPTFVVSHDQKRITTPAAALAAGSDFLVIGRPITEAKNPLQALERVMHEIQEISV